MVILRGLCNGDFAVDLDCESVSVFDNRHGPDGRAVAAFDVQWEARKRKLLGKLLEMGQPLDDHDFHALLEQDQMDLLPIGAGVSVSMPSRPMRRSAIQRAASRVSAGRSQKLAGVPNMRSQPVR